MKQIIPFKQELLFKTKINEITSISLEHTLSLKEEDIISGEFIITGDYKMTASSINREKFSFNLPFEIALDSRYDVNNITIDIDNFYYEVVNDDILLVNIDVYFEGEKIKEFISKENTHSLIDTIQDSAVNKEDNKDELREVEDILPKNIEYSLNKKEQTLPPLDIIPKENDITDECLNNDEEESKNSPKKENTKEDIIIKEDTTNINNNFNIFDNIDTQDTYVTYYVYIVKEEDTIDSIVEKYGVSKESISNYNDITNIKTGDKIIIPNKNE